MENSADPHQTDQVLAELQAALDALVLKKKSLDKARTCLKTGQRKLTKGGTKPLKALRELITNIQKLGTGPREPDLGALTDRLSKHVQQISAQAERMFHAGLRTAAAEAGVEVGRCGDRLSIGPFALLINMENESASIEYAKLAVETGLPLDPQSLVASIATHAASLLNKPDDLPGLSAEVQEAIRVTLARQTRSITSAELRAELPSVFREMTFIRQSRRSRWKEGGDHLVPSTVRCRDCPSRQVRFQYLVATASSFGNSRH